MHGAGNDYIYVNTLFYDVPQPSEAASLWSDRHKGIGADGLVLIGLSQVPEADFTMRMFNADGSEGMMCGNAARCIGKYLYERGLTDKTEIRLLTLSGVKTLRLTISSGKVESVTVDMGEPLFKDDMLFVPNSEIEQKFCIRKAEKNGEKNVKKLLKAMKETNDHHEISEIMKISIDEVKNIECQLIKIMKLYAIRINN